MKLASFVASAIVTALLAPSAFAQVTSYEGGTFSFDYAEFPVGLYGGSFLSDGVIEDLEAFPPTGTGASYAVMLQVPGRAQMLIVGGHQNPDGTGDVAFVFLNKPNTIQPAVHVVDPISYSAIFGFIDDVSSFQAPTDPYHTDLAGWIAAIVADHKFLSMNGTVTISSIDPSLVTGSFSGLMARTTGAMLVSAINGSFEIGTTPLPVSAETWAEIKSKFADEHAR